MKSMEVVQTFNRTSLSDRAANRVWDFGNPAKIQGRMQKRIMFLCTSRVQKKIVLCYLYNRMGSINIHTEDLLRNIFFFFFFFLLNPR